MTLSCDGGGLGATLALDIRFGFETGFEFVDERGGSRADGIFSTFYKKYIKV